MNGILQNGAFPPSGPIRGSRPPWRTELISIVVHLKVELIVNLRWKKNSHQNNEPNYSKNENPKLSTEILPSFPHAPPNRALEDQENRKIVRYIFNVNNSVVYLVILQCDVVLVDRVPFLQSDLFGACSCLGGNQLLQISYRIVLTVDTQR